MATAFSCFGDRTAPVFDSSQQIIIAENNGAIHRCRIPNCCGYGESAAMLKSSGVTTIVCGAVSNEYRRELECFGIEVIPFVSGKISSIMKDYSEGRNIGELYAMPGCRRRTARRRRRRKICRDLTRRDRLDTDQ